MCGRSLPLHLDLVHRLLPGQSDVRAPGRRVQQHLWLEWRSVWPLPRESSVHQWRLRWLLDNLHDGLLRRLDL